MNLFSWKQPLFIPCLFDLRGDFAKGNWCKNFKHLAETMLWISLLILRTNSGLWKRISHCWNIPWDDSSVLSNSTWWAFVIFLPGTLSFDFASTIEEAKLHWKFCFLCCGRFASENALTFPNLERDTRPIRIRFPVSLALKPWQSATKSETPRQNIPVCSSTLTKLLVCFCDLDSRSCSASWALGHWLFSFLFICFQEIHCLLQFSQRVSMACNS